ncbi:MAG: Peptidyl-tRNA hydrolase [candidate division WS6 bacterium GW2011_GWF2_39_15]|uniref:Peptidyl-tRNA hydrolase n=1 Tax=candidate division WS6 bacterium GW2011_GWF2_39_15 TaxID=1619100 RepID=A0A0G0N0I7_9BACT|nr:MAG: Peptidyl-tRNA hydrolase [candidate division WS6 bacterium GW2011_GWF2_39_15]
MIVVGLGNPGERYRETRHNAGFMFVERLRDYLEREDHIASQWETEDLFSAQIAKCEYMSIPLVLLKPQLFMNRSGEVVAKYLDKKEIKDIEKELILVHDDLDIKMGEYKIQFGISPRGHNGVNDVESKIGSINYRRVRIGVDDRIDRLMPPDEYVLQRLDQETLSALTEAVDKAILELIAQLQE